MVVVFVAVVGVSGRCVVVDGGELTVRGRLTGTLTLHGFALSGWVGGAPVHTRLAAL